MIGTVLVLLFVAAAVYGIIRYPHPTERRKDHP